MGSTASARTTRTGTCAALAVTIVALTPAAGSAVPGAPDTTFGPRGMRIDPTMLQSITEDGTSFGRLTALTGNRIAATTGLRCGMDCRSTVIARYLSTGSPDSGFATNGQLSLLTQGTDQDPATVWTPPVIARDGSMITMGGGRLVRYAPDGTVASDAASANTFVPVAVTPDGRIVGRTDVFVSRGSWKRTVALYGPDGSIDPSVRPVTSLGRTVPAVTVARGSVWVAFPTAARRGVPAGLSVRLVRRPLDGGAGIATRVSVQSPGIRRTVTSVDKILVGRAGRATVLCQLTRRQLLVGIAADGSLDRRFGSRGLLPLEQAGARVHAAAVQRDGRIVVATAVPSPTEDGGTFVVRRLSALGRSDATYPPRRFTLSDNILGQDVAIDDAGRAVIGFGALAPNAATGRLRLLRLLGE